MFITRSAWGARPAKPGPGRLDPHRVEGFCLHWPGMAKPLRGIAAVSTALRGWQTFHMDTKDWSDIAYNVAVDQDGHQYRLRGIANQSGANGNEDLNERYVAILLVLAPGEQPTAEMVKTVRNIIRRGRRRYPRAQRLIGHGQIRPGGTQCPGHVVLEHIARGTFDPTRKAHR